MNLLGERIAKLRTEPNAMQRYVSRRAFPVFERLGFHVVGNHFYEPLPDTRRIVADYRDEPRAHLGIDFRLASAEDELLSLLETHASAFEHADELGYTERNHYFRGLDAVTLFARLRADRPRTVIEIGTGYSTSVAAAALELNAAEGDPPSLVTIDPFDRHSLKRAPRGVEVVRVRAELQSLALDRFAELEAGDVLFVDSSHVHKFGSDVEFQFEQVYPVLAPGVIVHVHDVFSPYPYPLAWYTRERRFWNEQSYLETLLRSPSAFRVQMPVHALARQSARIAATCARVCTWDGYRHRGSSFYLERAA